MKIIINLIPLIFLFSGISYSQCIVYDEIKIFPVHRPYDNSFSSSVDAWNWPDRMEDGKYVQFFMDDTTKIACSGQYSNRVLDGCFKCFFPNGNIKISREYNNGAIMIDSLFFLNGKVRFISIYTGESMNYDEWRFSSGEIKSKRTNTNYKEWYENGNLKFEKNYINGELHGDVILNYENGDLKYWGNWEKGKQKGKSKYSKKKGSRYKEMEFRKLPKKIKSLLKVENY